MNDNKTLSVISLGCAKNLVNTEQMLALLDDAGFEIISSPEGADIVLINTCGFIESAKKEAIEAILEVAKLKEEGKCGKIIVTGCLAERYKDTILQELPEIDAVLGVGSFEKIVAAANAVLKGENYSSFDDQSLPVPELPRIITTGPSWAWLRIAEGCNNFCAFCAIPYIRGRYRSRKMEDIIAEAAELADHGIKEIIVIAQDITRYGTDLYGKRCLAELIRKLSEIEGIKWIRLHYLYPDQFDDELIDEIAKNPKVLKYLDIPIQHINNNILKKMNRKGTGEDIKALFKTLKDKIPHVVIRTTFITGLPGEGEEEFEELLNFLREARLPRVGVFPFCPEEGTAAAKMDYPDSEIAEKRAELLMQVQAPIMDEFCQSFVGKTLDVLIEEYDEDEDLFVGRTYADSPDIDGVCYVEGNCTVGEIQSVIIEDAGDGELFGRLN